MQLADRARIAASSRAPLHASRVEDASSTCRHDETRRSDGPVQAGTREGLGRGTWRTQKEYGSENRRGSSQGDGKTMEDLVSFPVKTAFSATAD